MIQPVLSLVPSALSYDEMLIARRLSGFCLAPAGSLAMCYTSDEALRGAMRQFKPGLRWVEPGDEASGLDLIVADGILQDAYSRDGKTMHAVREVLGSLIDKLKMGGRLILRENALMIPEQIVRLELPDHRAKVGDVDPAQAVIARLSEFAKTARPWLPDELQGFYLEELNPQRPQTRLFKLPLKWASEFVLRKDLNDEAWEESLQREFFLGSERSLRTQVLNMMGLRVVLSAPHWDSVRSSELHRTFQLYSDDEMNAKLPPPATELVLVAQKTADEDALWLVEQRSHERDAEGLGLTNLQNVKTGDMMTMVTGLDPETQIFPWCRLADNKLGVYMRCDIVKPMVCALPRANSIDGRRFSAHVNHPLRLETRNWEEMKVKGKSGIASWLFDETGLRIAPYSETVEGQLCFPAPDFIDQALGTVFVEVRPDAPSTDPDFACYEASDLLQAIHAGLLPSATLESQLWQLARHAGIEIVPLTDRGLENIPIDEDADDSLEVTDFEALCRKLMPDENEKKAGAFREVRGHSGDWRVTRSLFVAEGSHGPQSAYDQEFVVNDGEPLHRAALMCLSRRLQGDTLAGFEIADCPVPTRYGKPGKMVRVPTISLPTSLRSMPEAREYIAQKLEVKPQDVIPCGEAVYTHIGVTPQKIFPFLITKSSWFKHYNYVLTPLNDIRRLTQLDNHYSILWYWGAFMAFLGDNTEFTKTNSWESRTQEREARHIPDMVLKPVA